MAIIIATVIILKEGKFLSFSNGMIKVVIKTSKKGAGIENKSQSIGKLNKGFIMKKNIVNSSKQSPEKIIYGLFQSIFSLLVIIKNSPIKVAIGDQINSKD